MKKKIGLSILLIFILIQFIPVKRENPPNMNEITGKEELISILKRSCYDCHSNLTKYPAYSYIAPISWLIIHHINEGREALNFSDWNSLTLKKKSSLAYDIIEEIEEKEMPMKGYLLIHRDATLNEADLDIIKKWADEIDEEYLNSIEK